jgi:polysaccharide deacetylase family protein (PEP-CTERM system associated)
MVDTPTADHVDAVDRVRPPVAGGERSHLLTVVLEDYFHVAPLKSVVHDDHWYRFERRVESNTIKTLDLLDEYDVRATFFVLGWIAQEMPEIVREVARRGHEIASKGFAHRSIRDFSRDGFRDDVRRSRDAIENATGDRVDGYRIAHAWFGAQDLWALDVLIEEGFAYDSSIRPLFWSHVREPWRRKPHRHRSAAGELWEFPLPTWTAAGFAVPIAGGNYLRQFPDWLMRRAVRAWVRRSDAPFLMYFHVWELDPDQPRIRAAPLRERIRQYRNLDKMERVIRSYLEWLRFTAIGDHLGLRDAPNAVESLDPSKRDGGTPYAEIAAAGTNAAAVGSRTPVTVVIPCFNEELVLPYLANTLDSVERTLVDEYDLQLVFVDDGSTDTTWAALNRMFGGRPGRSLVRHRTNRGVAAAILTGIREATTDIVCSIDCDCTYDPHQLGRLIPLLTDGVDMVTASPYHEDGLVRNVPRWRLFLSRSLSALYRVVLNQRLATYTSCFRVYRRSSVENMTVHEGGFLGVAEMLGRLDLAGGAIVECPAVLEVRLLGRSKMKTVRTIVGHLRLLSRLGWVRLRGLESVVDDRQST